MKELKFKGYMGIITDVDYEAGIIHGEVLLTKGVVTFEADSVKKLIKEFRTSVEDYLDFCKEEGISPERPLKGEILVRCGKNLHAEVVKLIASRKLEGKKISQNEWCKRAIRNHLELEKKKVGT